MDHDHILRRQSTTVTLVKCPLDVLKCSVHVYEAEPSKA